MNGDDSSGKMRADDRLSTLPLSSTEQGIPFLKLKALAQGL